MHLTSIYLSVIMLLSYVTGSKVEDLSDICTDGQIHDIYLTFGLKASDDFVSMLTTQDSFNCILSFSVKTQNYIMVVLEFPDLMKDDKICVYKEASNNSVILSDYSVGKNCQYTGSEPAYRSLSLEKSFITLQTLQDISTIKLTVTSLRGLKDFECFIKNETECMYADQVYCMTNKVSCDGHINCGIPDVYDEDLSACSDKSFTILMKIATMLMGILTIFLFGSICLTLLPKRREPFVYRTDENADIFDDDECEIIYVEVDIQIVFSNNF